IRASAAASDMFTQYFSARVFAGGRFGDAFGGIMIFFFAEAAVATDGSRNNAIITNADPPESVTEILLTNSSSEVIEPPVRLEALQRS
ncbi:MAG: hypothetical protein ACR2O4_11570, partial [Hyphomicrobiaceae bacterium]